MRLTFIGKDPDSNPTGSPTVYRTDRKTWVVQGWQLTDPEALAPEPAPQAPQPVEEKVEKKPAKKPAKKAKADADADA